ncbi:syntaxin-6 [Hippocampus zosterae]|uniref:syntaxin-6 n=1 Tax=Hippocampus zosterae TaxID=109293 RepID=UPI00223D4A56|nr:syntaxin-6 [Hippocampus zosterae]
MSMEDPFFVVKGEVQKAVSGAQSLHRRWSQLLLEGAAAPKEELDWTTNELRNSLRSIEWDLEDLDETISIVESNPKKFNLDAAELAKRKAFICSTRRTVEEMKERMSGGAAVAFVDTSDQQALLGDGAVRDKSRLPERRLRDANSDFIGEQQLQQQLMAERQDEQLELVSGTIGVLKNMSERIGLELDEQADMLDDFGQELDTTHSRLDNVMKKLAKVSHMTSDRRQWCAIGVLLAILSVVALLLFIL